MPAAIRRSAQGRTPHIDQLSAQELNALITRASDLLAIRQKEMKADLLDKLRQQAAASGFSIEELMGRRADGRKRRSDAGTRLGVKYRGPNGETYSGRGPVPRWLRALEAKGAKRDRFLVKA